MMSPVRSSVCALMLAVFVSGTLGFGWSGMPPPPEITAQIGGLGPVDQLLLIPGVEPPLRCSEVPILLYLPCIN